MKLLSISFLMCILLLTGMPSHSQVTAVKAGKFECLKGFINVGYTQQSHTYSGLSGRSSRNFDSTSLGICFAASDNIGNKIKKALIHLSKLHGGQPITEDLF